MKIDPNAKASSKDKIYGLPFNEKESQVVFLPIPWDVTTSYQSGAAKGPKAILEASPQIDLFDLEYIDAFEQGMFLRKENAKIKKLNTETRKLAEKIINADEDKVKKNKVLQSALKKVNERCEEINDIVYQETKQLLKQGKMPVIIGGDHATPFGAIKAYAEEFKDMGILHFDAHSDTRIAYMGFEYSHASIMYNVMEKIKGVSKLVQVGIRDFCEQEFEYTDSNKKIQVYFDQHMQYRKIQGDKFSQIAKEIVGHLPQKVYISFDIDGLDPKYCPNTGTPVPGGLEFQEVCFILKSIVDSGRTIVGVDLVEVAPSSNKKDEWDANVGMRLLYKMISAALASQKKIKLR